MNNRRTATRLQSLVPLKPRETLAPRNTSSPGTLANAAERVRPQTSNSMVDAGIYLDGQRISSPSSLPNTFRELNKAPGSMAWIGLVRPEESELQELAAEFDLHELAVEDAVMAHQRSKIERYGTTLFAVLRATRYLESQEEVEFGELHIFVGPNFIITVRHGHSPDLATVRRRMEQDQTLLRLGPEAVLYAILDTVVDGFAPVVTGLENDIDEIETEVFSGDPQVSRRIYELSREVIEFQRSTKPMVGILESAGRRLHQVRHQRGPAAVPARCGRPRQAGQREDRRFPVHAPGHPDRERHTRGTTPERGNEAPGRGQQRPE